MYYNNTPYYYTNGYSNNMYRGNNRNDRLFGGGFLIPFVLGGIAGGAIANNNNKVIYPYPYPMPVYNYPVYYNNYYPPYYYY